MNTHRGLAIAFAVLATGAVLAGCGKAMSPAPSSAPGAGSSVSGEGGTQSFAPKVTGPLKTGALLSDACVALSATQLRTLGLEKGEPRTIETGKTCSWQYTDGTSNTVNISPIEPNKNGLGDLYSDQDKKAYFEPTETAGYPAVYADITDDRNRGRCGLYVGVTDQLSVYILTQLDDGADVRKPCPVADKIGAAMIKTLREG